MRGYSFRSFKLASDSLFSGWVSKIIWTIFKFLWAGQSVQKGRALAKKSVLHSIFLLATSLYAVPVHWLCLPKRIYREVVLSGPLFCSNLKKLVAKRNQKSFNKVTVQERWLVQPAVRYLGFAVSLFPGFILFFKLGNNALLQGCSTKLIL